MDKPGLRNLIIQQNETIRNAIKIMDEIGKGIVIIVDKANKVYGILTNGDFRKAVIKGNSLDESVKEVCNKEFISVGRDYTKEDVRTLFGEKQIQHLIVLHDNELVDLITEDDFNTDENLVKNNGYKLNCPVVIMAGGKGERLLPITRILPKPLIPIGDDPIIKTIMDQFYLYGMENFYLTLNHKSKLIRAFIDDQNYGYNINYIVEENELGTAGSLRYLINKIDNSFFVSNCDILIKANYSKIHQYHKDGNYLLTLVASMKHFEIPYGVCGISKSGDLIDIVEKPTYDYLVSTGMYVLEPEVIKYIPDNTKFHMTDLIAKLQKNDKKIGIFPISEKSWIDIGELDKFKSTINLIVG